MKELIVDIAGGIIRAAITEDGYPIELYAEENDLGSIVGSVYNSRVKVVLPGMKSAFVDLGTREKNAVLFLSDILNDGMDMHKKGRIEDLIYQEQELLVQVNKDGYGSKGPKVTTKISLPGSYSVITPYDTGTGISKRIQNIDEQRRLRSIANKIKDEFNCGLILRTSAEYIGEELIRDDVNVLVECWNDILNRARIYKAPALVYRDGGLVCRLIRENISLNIDSIIALDRRLYDELLGYLPKNMLDKTNLRYDADCTGRIIDSFIEETLTRTVPLGCGANIIIDKVEAMTVIDVNSGSCTGEGNFEDNATMINIEAAKEISRQIRLRHIGGIIIIDFIDMALQKNRESVLKTLNDGVSKDRSKCFVLGYTRLGLVEMTRKEQYPQTGVLLGRSLNSSKKIYDKMD